MCRMPQCLTEIAFTKPFPEQSLFDFGVWSLTYLYNLNYVLAFEQCKKAQSTGWR